VSRAGALWNALTDDERNAVTYTLSGVRDGQFLAAIVADARALAPPGDGFRFLPEPLIPESAAGPRLPAERCDDCGEAVTTGRIAFYDWAKQQTLHLGPGCWRDRALARARGDEVAGEQLELRTEER
jgi:hypothetical protein